MERAKIVNYLIWKVNLWDGNDSAELFICSIFGYIIHRFG
ncbi:hypothetical protein J2X69_001655 [Algoriphagus sp. 4150]|nr:hypothetical protein [Algoriphagus sp. 4150]